MPYDVNETHDPNLKSWIESANDPNTDFPIQNLPFCRFHDGKRILTAGVRIGERVLDLAAFLVKHPGALPLATDANLPGLLTADPAERRGVRSELQRLLRADAPRDAREVERFLLPIDTVQIVLPLSPSNYTDFYASIHHAATVGSMFRPDNPLLPNYKWVPIGYHGRASSIIASGTEIHRPGGQTKADDAPGAPPTPPAFGPSKMLDYEMEVGLFVGRGNNLGEPIPIEHAEDHIFGLCLVNDWSARDFQKWEYQPLGPFLAKNFATSVSPYIVTMEALAPFRCPAMKRPEGDPAPLPYLRTEQNQKLGGIDITLEVHLASKQMRDRGMSPIRLSRGSFKDMYWTIAQLLTHHASNGCNLQPGDLLASGTISGQSPDSRGCLLELTWQGRDAAGKPLPRRPIDLPTGEKRLFLEDGDEIIMKGYCEREGFRRIGFGECRGVIVPAKQH